MKAASPSIWIPILTAILVATFLLTSSLLGACGPSAPPSAPEQQAGMVTLVDAKGRTVEFAEPPQRIVVAGKSSLTIIDTLYLFPEAKERVVGVGVGQQNPGDFISFVDPTFDQKVTFAPDAGPEQIAPLKPDVVVLRSFMAETLGEPLDKLDIPVVYLDLETPEQYFRDVATVGRLFGNSARAEEIRSFYQSRLDRVDENVGNLSNDQKPHVLVIQYTDQGGEVALNVPSASWIQTTEAELAGGVPVWKEAALGGGWMVVNFEQIAAWAPDMIFVIHYKADPAEVVDELKGDPQWQALRAVQEGQIYGFAADIFSWDQPDPRWILGVTWLAARIHPDRFPDLDMMQEVAQFFVQMYGMKETAVQEQILPNLKGDVE